MVMANNNKNNHQCSQLQVAKALHDATDKVNATQQQPASAYEEMVARLYQTPFFHPVSSGLSNIQKLHSLIGNPMDDPDVVVIHIAGTNGKGSVALKLAKTLALLLSNQNNTSSNICLYSSPHVCCFRERIQCNGHLVSEELVAQFLQQIFDLCEQHDIPATFFEITTTLAFLYFQQCHENIKQQQLPSKKSIVILEAGLGGRLDATNVVSVPALTILTSVGFDHTNILGRSLDKIAIEKAGIIKANIPCLVGPQVPHETVRNFVQQQEHLSPDQLYFILDEEEKHLISANNSENAPSLEAAVSDYDKVNTRIAMEAIHLLRRSSNLLDHLPDLPVTLLEEGTSARPLCRFEILPLKSTCRSSCKSIIILDVAHNPAAMKCLVSKLRNYSYDKSYSNSNDNRANPISARFLLGLSRDKDWRGIFEALSPLMTSPFDDKAPNRVRPVISKIHLAQADHPKSFPLESLVAELQTLQLPCTVEKHGFIGNDVNAMLEYNIKEPSVTHQLNLAHQAAAAQEGREVLVVCGSVHLMAEVRHWLGIQEPRDSKYLLDVATGIIPTSRGVRYGNSEPALPPSA